MESEYFIIKLPLPFPHDSERVRFYGNYTYQWGPDGQVIHYKVYEKGNPRNFPQYIAVIHEDHSNRNGNGNILHATYPNLSEREASRLMRRYIETTICHRVGIEE